MVTWLHPVPDVVQGSPFPPHHEHGDEGSSDCRPYRSDRVRIVPPRRHSRALCAPCRDAGVPRQGPHQEAFNRHAPQPAVPQTRGRPSTTIITTTTRVHSLQTLPAVRRRKGKHRGQGKLIGLC